MGAGVALMVKLALLPSVTAEPPLIVNSGVVGVMSSSLTLTVALLGVPRL